MVINHNLFSIHSIKNAYELKEISNDIQIEANEMIMPQDVISLFPRIF